jgi:ABC-type transporter MlaC component
VLAVEGLTSVNGTEASEEAGVPWSGILSSWRGDEAMVRQRIVESLHPVVDVVLVNNATMGRSIRGLSHYDNIVSRKE